MNIGLKVSTNMTIKQPVINTFDRVGIDYKSLDNVTQNYTSINRFSGAKASTTQLISALIAWVYRTSNAYEAGDNKIKLSDFDRIRYFIMEQDSNAYMTCID